MKKTFTLLFSALIVAFSANAQNFTEGNLAVFVTTNGSGNTGTTASIVELSPVTAGQTALKTTAIDGTGSKTLLFSASASSTGYLSRSDDGTLLTFTGHTSYANPTTENINTVLTRAVGTLNFKHEYNRPAEYTATGGSGDQARSATTFDNSNWVIADQRGFFTNGGTARLNSSNFRSVKPFGKVAYTIVSNLINTLGLTQVSGGPITGVTVTALSGLPVTNNTVDFYLISSGNNGANYDVLYVLSSDNTGTISKFSLVSGSWTSNGSYTTGFGGFGLAVEKAATGANLYATTGTGATAANSVIKLNDAAGFNTAISINAANNVTLYTTAAGTIIKGIDFAPVDPATLPIKLSSFNGKALNNTLVFDWATTEEVNFSHFEIEKSFDGKTFTKLADVQSKKQATGSHYEYTTVKSGSYFRLKSVDLDGKFEYSKVIYIANKSSVNDLLVFPNPATDYITVQLANDTKNNTLTITSATGQTVRRSTFSGNSSTVKISDLAKGVYYIKVTNATNNTIYTKSVIVK